MGKGTDDAAVSGAHIRKGDRDGIQEQVRYRCTARGSRTGARRARRLRHDRHHTTPAGAAANTVTASGTGTTQAAPDTAEMSFGVTTMSPNAKSALDDASKIAEQIASAVKKQGVADEDIQTRDVSVYPQTADQNGKQVITGYQASLSVQVKVRDIAKLGEIISAANAAGANTISGPTFTIDDPAPARAKAIDEAVADARKSAEAMAKAAGKSVGEVLSMSSSDVGSVPGPMSSASDMAGAAKACPSSRVSSTSPRTWSWSSSSSSSCGAEAGSARRLLTTIRQEGGHGAALLGCPSTLVSGKALRRARWAA